jgi:hypothetical protein
MRELWWTRVLLGNRPKARIALRTLPPQIVVEGNSPLIDRNYLPREYVEEGTQLAIASSAMGDLAPFQTDTRNN